MITCDSALAGKLFTMDAASFSQRGGLIYQEIFFLIQRDRLKFDQAVDGYEAEFQITVNVIVGDSTLSTTSWQIVDRALKLEDIKPTQKLPDLVAFNLVPGSYTIEGHVLDLKSEANYTEILKLDLTSFPEAELAISDIVLAMKLQKGGEGSKFYKNGFLVIPNPERIYGTDMDMLYYYVELYNLQPSDADYFVERTILDDAKQLVSRLPQKTRQKVGASLVEVDGFSLETLNSGTYYLQLKVTDSETEQSASAMAKFFIYRPDDFKDEGGVITRTGPTPLETVIRSYNEAELETAIAELKMLVSEGDWRLVEGLNEEGKRQYVINYWNERDPQPMTAVNEYRLVFEKRKRQAIDKYSIWDTPGWKTNRGRVWIVYGTPDDVEYHPHDPSTRSYEIWFYDSLEGGVQFVFVDRNGFGDYRLVHSSKKGELYRSNWFEEEAMIRKQ
ncbi:GWxTD domain-containing protein [bacterium]|nr:GWxTD domain-containing protein [bacterium]